MTTNDHDEINLRRLIRRLDKSSSESEWTWITVQSTLQKVKFARKLLNNVQLEDVDPTPESVQRYNDFKAKLDRIDALLQDLDKKNAPKRTRPEPILPSIPLPPDEPQEQTPIPDQPPLPADNLLLSESDVALSSSVSPPLTTTLLPTSFPSAATKSTTTAVEPRLLQHSTARQRDMSEQMELMARQLKLNSLHFAELLEKDRQVVEETDKKLEENYGFMQKIRVGTRDLRGKTGSTTCLSLLIVLFVTLVFLFMVSLVRFT
ncbi:hypothetical protein FB45DRAFT_918662 [Roridomyces roridus]|uniref:Uncharacterized protein n=1 Tax=Roridomyces roridus TaxID=1738132 RepID=A0AAD7BRH9_9AGAR|nr:hypothetical protein FB45DRAFT_918662 [Roridomyces roridus]